MTTEEETKQEIMEEAAGPATEDEQQPERRDHFRELLVKQKTLSSYCSARLLLEKQQQQQQGEVDVLPAIASVTSATGADVEAVWTAAKQEEKEEDEPPAAGAPAAARIGSASEKQQQQQRSLIDKYVDIVQQRGYHVFTFPMEVRLKGVTYKALVDPAEDSKIRTVYNSSFLYKIHKFCQRQICNRGERPRHPRQKETKVLLDNINLVFSPGKMYLVLGAPGSGKTSLLKAIAGRLDTNAKKGLIMEGTVSYNGKTLKDKTKYHIENAVSFIDQLDRHAPRLTVQETFEFAYQCKTGGIPPWKYMEGQLRASNTNKEMGEKTTTTVSGFTSSRVDIIMELLGLTQVKDTFVGDETVRGVSGGQRRRVTVGEMLMDFSPLLCGDEISTGLDATSTFDMVAALTHFGRMQHTCRVIALLQPSPETVSLFDDVIVLAPGGKILYAGPLATVQTYFEHLGYHPPEHMDIADFLQLLCTPDAAMLWRKPAAATATTEDDPEDKSVRTSAYSVDELAELFQQSQYAKAILEELEAPPKYVWDETTNKNPSKSPSNADANTESTQTVATHLSQIRAIRQKYANAFPRAVWLNLKRSLTLWTRDKRVLIANAVKNGIMGISVGGVFFQTEDVVSILGVLFQSMLFIMLCKFSARPRKKEQKQLFLKYEQLG
jgi:ABC-type multidrug transport system ATPase subunit